MWQLRRGLCSAKETQLMVMESMLVWKQKIAFYIYIYFRFIFIHNIYSILNDVIWKICKSSYVIHQEEARVGDVEKHWPLEYLLLRD